MTSRRIGAEAELWVKGQLEQRGYRIIAINFRSPRGEIDLVGIEGNMLVLVEVKARNSLAFGRPSEAVNGKKLLKISMTEELFRVQYPHPLPQASRIDVVEVLRSDGKDWQMEIIKHADII